MDRHPDRQFHSVRLTARRSDSFGWRHMGMIGFDIACETARSGPRMQGYLVNAPCDTITANNKQSDFALAA